MADRLYLCATARLAQALRDQPAAQTGAWATPRALTIGAWLVEALEAAMLRGTTPPLRLLDGPGERLLWERVIADSLADDSRLLFDLPGMAAAAQEAHGLCELWQLRPAHGPLAEETRLFLGWRREFTRRCDARGWLDAARLPGLVRDLIAAGQGELPAQVTFAGFDRFTPAEAALRAALADRGVTVDDQPQPASAPRLAQTIPCDGAPAECRAVAAWAKAMLTAHPQYRLGIVAPNLAEVRDPLAFALDDALHPEALLPGAAAIPRRYNFSLGQPLTAQPLAQAALDLLALGCRRDHEQAPLGELLRSPYWSAGTGEADSRARIDAAMRRELEYFTDLPALVRLAKRLFASEGLSSPALLRQLEDFIDATAKAGARRLPSAWARSFEDWLRCLRWPGDRPLDSGEFQAREAFRDTLAGLGRYDDILGPIGAGEALRRLAQAAGERVFQPETRGAPAIEIMGVLESTGLTFDALWVMGMNDHAWPAPARPNPLLPAELQRRAGTPHASAEVELAFAATVHRRLLAAAPEVSFSWMRQDGNRLLRPSPLVAGLIESLAPVAESASRPTISLERLADTQAPSVAPGEKVPGGTGLLKAQAVCPAWGFYQYRLGAKALRPAVEGLDAMERGTLVHGALEHFWQAVAGRAALLALDAAAEKAHIAEAVAAALADFEEASHRQLPARFRELEALRLGRLLAAWLAVERQRPPFTVVAREQEVTLEIEGIQVRTVIDRIDRLEDGGLVVLDYKTGQRIDTRNWAEARITEPQLPIYAAIAVPQAGGQPVAGVAFARVVLDEPGFAGVGAAKGLLPGITGLDDPKRRSFTGDAFPDWPAVLRHWHERIQAVAAEVGAGEAAVRFSDPQGLAYCEVVPLLRLAEYQQQLEAAAR